MDENHLGNILPSSGVQQNRENEYHWQEPFSGITDGRNWSQEFVDYSFSGFSEVLDNGGFGATAYSHKLFKALKRCVSWGVG